MITFENVSFRYRWNRNVINSLSFTVNTTERVCFIGPSGCGKTTVLRLLLGLEKPREGAVHLSEKTEFSVVFQNDRLLPNQTILQNVALFSDVETAENMLRQLGLEEHLHCFPSELSGGMKRRAALARALCHPFSVLVLDEPFTGLDENRKKQCIDLVDRMTKGKTLVLVTHDESEILALNARTIPV